MITNADYKWIGNAVFVALGVAIVILVVVGACSDVPRRKKIASDRAWTKRRINEMRQREGDPAYAELRAVLKAPDVFSLLGEKDRLYLEHLSQSVTKKHAEELYRRACRGDVDSLDQLVDLVLADHDERDAQISLYSAQTGEAYAFPADWNNLVASAFVSPSLGSFIGCERNPERGSVRLRAAGALLPSQSWMQQLLDAKIVLAYANERGYDGRYTWRDEVGPVLLAEVSKLVVSIHRAQGPVIAPVTSTE